MTADDWKSVVDVHLNGSFYVASAAAQHFRQQESGAFVFMVSASGLIGAFGQANYAAAKLGMTALSTSIAIDMKRYNVRSEEHTSELQSLMRISYAVFCLKKKKQ